MNNCWNNYHKITDNNPPRKNIIKFIDKYNNLTGNAIDLGCGARCDTIYLIKHNWNVLSIDSTDVENKIRKKLSDDMQDKFCFQVQRFEDLHLPKSDLIISNYALPFCNKDYFYNMWQEVCNSINENGFFVGNFFGLKDEWNTKSDKRTFLSKQKIIELFKDFDIIECEEIEKDRPTTLGKMKHWHTFEVIARKKLTLSCKY